MPLAVILHLMGHCYHSWAQCRKTVHCDIYTNLSCMTLPLAEILLSLACYLDPYVLTTCWGPDIGQHVGVRLGQHVGVRHWPTCWGQTLASILGSDLAQHAGVRHWPTCLGQTVASRLVSELSQYIGMIHWPTCWGPDIGQHVGVRLGPAC